MENLVTKNVTFEGLLATLDNSKELVFDFIMNLKNKEVKARLCDEARDYYATYFNIKKEDVWYGNLTRNEIPTPFPYTHIVGDLNWIVGKDMSKLVYVAGNIKHSYIEEYANLEVITGFGDFYNSCIKSLPKLKKVGCLGLSNSPIEDIHSLVLVESFLACNNTNIKYVNPDLEIMGTLHCEISNHFEEKLDKTKKHNWWYTDNPKIL